MPMAIKRFCGKSGCGNIIDAGTKYCEAHQAIEHKRYDQYRESAAKRGYDSKWRGYSRRFLRENPLCACDECKKLPVPLPSEVTDHIIPHKGDKRLFWDRNNHQPMAKRCHDRKTAREDGGFGNEGKLK